MKNKKAQILEFSYMPNKYAKFRNMVSIDIKYHIYLWFINNPKRSSYKKGIKM